MKKFVISSLLLGFCSMAQAFSSEEVAKEIDNIEPKKLNAVVVIKDGELKFEKYYNGSGADDLHNIRSASKTFTGLMYGVAIKDGYFKSAEQKVLPIFKEYTRLMYPSPEKTDMTFFDLLSMTNPLECDDMNDFSAGHEERMYLTHDWIGFFLNLPLRANPPWESRMTEQPYGRDFAYCTAGISITGAAIERVSGKRLSDYTEQALFKPLGITQAQWQYSESGITQGGGGVSIRPKDLAKIGQLVLQKGRWQGKTIIPPSWIEKSLQSYSVSMPDLNATYGITFWHIPFQVAGKTIDTYAAAGNGGNYMFVIPSLNTTAVIAASAYNTPYMHRQTHQILSQAILPTVMN